MRTVPGRRGSKSRGAGAVLIAWALTGVALVGSATAAHADVAPNSTPATAIPFSSVPFVGSDFGREPVPASDLAGQLVAVACNGGATIYGTRWWRYAAPQASTYVVHAGQDRGGVAWYEPLGLAVVSADAGTVLECGVPRPDITATGARTIAPGQSVLLVAYRVTDDFELSSTEVGVYPSTGVVPANDKPTAPTPIAQLPFSVTQDTTLATLDGGEALAGCYSKFGIGPDVFFRWTAGRTDVVELRATAAYEVHVSAVAMANGVPGGPTTCDEPLAATAGTSYLIAVWGISEDLLQAGTVTFTAAYIPPAPTMSIAVDPSGKVAKKSGVVTLTGTVGCVGASSTPSLSGTARQVYKRQVQTAALSFSGISSCGATGRWTATARSGTFLFTGGTVDVAVRVDACNLRGCSTSTATRTVKLKVA
jgi:hypothetical protein